MPENLLLIILAIIGPSAITIILFFNAVVKLNQIVREAFSTMDIYLKKRWDLIPNLVTVVKSYAKHESDTFQNITQLRGQTYESLDNRRKITLNYDLGQNLVQILAIAEQYPTLKADRNFQKLSEQLVQIEDEIANSRKYYNGAVRMYNTKIATFPNNFAAKLFRMKPYPMFETDQSSKTNVKVELE